MILLDTSAIYALASRKDPRHGDALAILARVSREGAPLFLHTGVLIESFALLHRRAGLSAALRMAEDLRLVETVAVDRSFIDRALARLEAGSPGGTSLVDAVSFEVMRERGLTTAFAFDPDFERAGFRVLTP